MCCFCRPVWSSVQPSSLAALSRSAALHDSRATRASVSVDSRDYACQPFVVASHDSRDLCAHAARSHASARIDMNESAVRTCYHASNSRDLSHSLARA